MPDSGFIFPPAFRVVDASIAAVPGGKLKFYQVGTTTPTTVYSDSTLVTSLGSTVYTDSAGHPVASSGSSTKVMIYTGATLIKLVVTDADDVTIATYDNMKCTEDTSSFGAASGSGIEGVTAKTADYSVVLADDGHWFDCDPTAAAFTMTLPSAATVGDGFAIGIRHAGTTTTNAVKVATVSSQTITGHGAATTADALTGGGEAVWLVSNGANWKVISHTPPRMPYMPFPIADRLTAAPASPAAGAFYLINGTPTLAWLDASYAQHDIVRANGAGGWILYRPYTDCGWLGYVQDEDKFVAFKGTAWEDQDGMGPAQETALKTATFQDQKANATAGGGATASAWTARVLNTEVHNSITGCSLASDTITLPAGSYLIMASSPFYNVNSAKVRFKSTTTATVINGTQVYDSTTYAGGTMATLFGRLTLSAEEAFKLEYYVETARATDGLGIASPESAVEIYSTVQIIDLTSLQGATGAAGAQGAPGANNGLDYRWNTATAGDPGSGKILIDNATIGSATVLSVSKTGDLAQSYGSILNSWDDSTSSTRGVIRISTYADRSEFMDFAITGAVTDNTTYYSFPISVVGSGGTPSLNDLMAVSHYRTGDKGDTGSTGAGIPWSFDSSTSMADPGTGDVRLNHATLSSVTAIAISDLCGLSGNPDVSAQVLAWDDSTNTVRGTLTIRKISAPQNIAIYNITGASTDNSGWTQLAVTHVASSGSFSAADSLGFQFDRAGNVGLDGVTSGIRYTFDSSTTMADPGTGEIRLSDADFSLVTAIAVSDLCGESGNPDLASFILSWDDSTNTSLRGTVYIKKASAPQNCAIYNITGATTDNTGWSQLSVTYVGGSGSFSASDVLSVNFTRTGNAGAAGTSGGAFLTTPDYANTGGTGDRTAIITVTTSASLRTSGTDNNLVDGATASNTTDSISFGAVSVSGHYVEFDFGPGASKVITEIRWKQSTTATHGTWKTQGYNDGAGAWSDIGASFTLGGATTQTITEPSANITGYRKYRLLGVSGTASTGPYVQEVEFKIGNSVLDDHTDLPAGGTARQVLTKYNSTDHYVTWTDQSGDLWTGLPSSVVSLYTFLETTGSTVYDKIGSSNLSLVATGAPTYTWTGKSLKIAAGVAERASGSAYGTFIIYRTKRNETNGFIVSGGSSSGAGVLEGSVTTAYTHHVGGGYGVHTLMMRSTGVNSYELNRGGWILEFCSFASLYTTIVGFGGRHSATTSRCADIEIAAVGILSGSLSDAERTQIYNVARRAMTPRGIYLHVDDCPVQAKLVIIHGESNPEGDDLITNLSAADQALTYTNVHMQCANSTTAANNAVRPWILQTGLNQRLTDATKFGPEIGLAKRWRTNFLTRRYPLVIFKPAKGSTYAAPVGTGSVTDGTSWHSGSSTANSLFNVAFMRGWYDLDQAMRNDGIGCQLAGIGQNIGLNDAVSTTNTTDAATYKGYRRTMYDALATYTGVTSPKLVVFRTHQYDTASNATALSHVRTAEADLVTDLGATVAVLVDTDAYTRQSGDAAHFDAAGTMTMGEALYDNLVTLGTL